MEIQDLGIHVLVLIFSLATAIVGIIRLVKEANFKQIQTISILVRLSAHRAQASRLILHILCFRLGVSSCLMLLHACKMALATAANPWRSVVSCSQYEINLQWTICSQLDMLSETQAHIAVPHCGGKHLYHVKRC